MPQPELRRSLTLLDATMINVGTMLASGIFITPAAVARDLEAPWMHLAVWAVAGVFSILGALVIGELGAMMPQAGGIYVYLNRAFGPLWGFLYGWSLFLAIQCGSIAAVAVAMATYLGWFVPLGRYGTELVAVASIAALTWVNARGVKEGAWVSNVLTLFKIAAALGLVALGAAAGRAAALWAPAGAAAGPGLAASLGAAMVAALWCYDGWIHVSYIAGELRDPGRVLPRAAVGSTLIVIALYVALNLSFLMLLGVEGMAGSDLVAAEAARAAVGAAGGGMVAALVAVSTLGANNGFILAGARVGYAMARDGLFFARAARVDPTTAVPVVALWLQALWSSVLVFSGKYNQIFTYVIFMEFVFYALAAVAVLVLRRREPAAERPYRAWGYPATPVAFVLFAAALLASTVWGAPREAGYGIAVLLAGLPAYLYWSAGARRRAAEGLDGRPRVVDSP